MAEHGWVYEDNGIIVYRASSFGNCTRSMVCARLGETAVGPRAGLRAAMDASSGLEDECVRRAEEQLGGPITDSQMTVELHDFRIPDVTVQIRGHIDGIGPDSTVIEIKALGEGNWEKFISGKDTLDGLKKMGTLGEKYIWQGALYGHATGKDVRYVIGEKKKVTEQFGPGGLEGPRDELVGWVIDNVIVCPPIPPEFLVSISDIMARVRVIEDHAARDELPPCDGGCRPGDPFAESHVFESFKSADDDARAKMARFQEIKDILGSADKGTGLLGEKEDLSEWMKENLGVGKHTAGMYNAVVSHVKPTERIDTKRLKKERPDIAEEYTTFGQPTIKLVVTGGETG